MEIREILNQLKNTVNQFFAKEEDVQNFIDVEDSDKNIYRLPESGLEVGAPIEKIQEDGTMVPVEDGVYVIEGNEVTVKDSVVAEIKPIEEAPAEEEAPAAEEEMVEEMPTEETPKEEVQEEMQPESNEEIKAVKVAIEEIAAMVGQIIEYVKQLDSRVSAIENVSEYEEKFSSLNERIEKLENKPVSTSVKTQKFATEETDPYILRLRKLKN